MSGKTSTTDWSNTKSAICFEGVANSWSLLALVTGYLMWSFFENLFNWLMVLD